LNVPAWRHDPAISSQVVVSHAALPENISLGTLGSPLEKREAAMAESLPDALNRQDVSTALSSIYVRDVVHFQSKSLEAGFPGRPGGRGGILALDRKPVCEAFQLIAKFYKDCVASVTANHLPYEVNSGRHGGY
jgi:hypothetical protein